MALLRSDRRCTTGNSDDLFKKNECKVFSRCLEQFRSTTVCSGCWSGVLGDRKFGEMLASCFGARKVVQEVASFGNTGRMSERMNHCEQSGVLFVFIFSCGC